MRGWAVQVTQIDNGTHTVTGRTGYDTEWEAVAKAAKVVERLVAQGWRQPSPGVLLKGDTEQRVTVESGRKFTDYM